MKWIIYTPPYRQNSMGIRVLHELQRQLVLLGEEALTTNIPIDAFDDDIVVLPEVFSPNMSLGKMVVRYYLNEPLADIDYSNVDVTITYNIDDFPQADFHINIPLIEPIFKNNGYERPYKAAYIGKGDYDGTDYPELMLISADWPPTRADLADFLNRCSELYTWDDKTAIITEALYCGCKVFVLQSDKFIERTHFDNPPPFKPELIKLILKARSHKNEKENVRR